MRLVSLLLIGAACFAAAAQSYNTYGKSEAEILSMSSFKWQEFYTSKAGDSTVSECDASRIYGLAIEHRNDKLAAHSSHGKMLPKLRAQLSAFAEDCIELAMNEDGGGTIWENFDADIAINVELVIYAMLGGTVTPPKHRIKRSLDQEFRLISASIKRTHEDKNAASYFKYGEAQASAKKIRSDARSVMVAAKGLNRVDAARVLAFCVNYADVAAKGLKGGG